MISRAKYKDAELTHVTTICSVLRRSMSYADYNILAARDDPSDCLIALSVVQYSIIGS